MSTALKRPTPWVWSSQGQSSGSGLCCLLIKGQWLCSPASVCAPVGVQIQLTNSLQLLMEVSLLVRAQPWCGEALAYPL